MKTYMTMVSRCHRQTDRQTSRQY